MPDYYRCQCGRLERSLRATSHAHALTVFTLDIEMAVHAEDVAGAKIISIRGPIRSRHEGTLVEFNRETREELRREDLRPVKRRR